MKTAKNDRGSAGWAGTAATKHSYYPSFIIFPSCFPPSFFSSIVPVLKLPFCSSFVSSPPLHTPILMLFICFPFVHPNEFSTTPSVFREKRGRVQSCHGNNKLAAGYLLPDFHWKRMMDIHFKPNYFYSQEKNVFFGWTKLLVNWSLHNQPESLFVYVGHQHFLVAVFPKIHHEYPQNRALVLQWFTVTTQTALTVQETRLYRKQWYLVVYRATGLESNINTWLISHWFINSSVWQLDGKTYI